jgi:hypothetical protein
MVAAEVARSAPPAAAAAAAAAHVTPLNCDHPTRRAVVLAWVFLAFAFYQDPAFLTGAQRLIQRGIEFVGDNIPPPWGPRIEFVFREVGGLIWLQITLLVLALRIVLSTLATIFRAARRRRAGLLYLD